MGAAMNNGNDRGSWIKCACLKKVVRKHELLLTRIFWYTLVSFIFLFSGLLLLAVIRELLGMVSSWARWIGDPTPQLISCCNIVAMKDVAKTVGISSILVVWIYNKLDARELGIKYSDLLREQGSGYYVCVITHILSILVCIWAAGVGSIECTALSLAIILLNMVLQMKVLLTIVLNTDRRKDLAYRVWQKRLDSSPGAEMQLGLEENIPCNDSEACKKMCELQMCALYCDQAPDAKTLSYSWETMMRGKGRKSQMVLADNCAVASSKCDGIKKEDKRKRCFCIWASYLLWYQRDLEEFHESQDFLTAIYNEIFRICDSGEADEDVKQCLQLCGSLLGTAYFMTGQARILNGQLTSLASAEPEWNICEALGKDFLKASLAEELPERIFEAVWQHSVKEQTIGGAVPV